MKLDPEIILVSQAYFKSHNALNALHELRFGHVGPPYKHFPDTNNTSTNTVLSFSAVLRFV